MPTATQARAAKPRLYVKNQIASRWRKEVESGRSCQFFSPYVTGRGAQNILLAAGRRHVELYTVFTLENFASGGSSLDCIERLVKEGLMVYHLPELHAKILLIPGRAVTIGSQNLTARGTVNREASILIEDERVIQRVADETATWLADRLQVTQPWIDDVRMQLRGVKRLFKKAKEAAEKAEREAAQRERERVERERQAEAERQRQEVERQRRLSNLRASVGGLRVASAVVRTRMQRMNPTWQRMSVDSLVPRSGCLTRWRLNDEIVDLHDCYRYLCVIEDTGKLGWARVASSRISFVASGAVHGEELEFRNRTWKITTSGRWDEPEAGGCNLTITIENTWSGEAELDCWFSVGGFGD